ncbi:3-hydroxyacyl-CoA dehydrogenase type-2-like [Contarinia nasturtii]|uniref:3-hydroxyacyl-CoA dehydrogenase type-2-like n=1 Tax=Contarinia nasturtii TaxID=265458 RepID=UPI0012D3BF64|nr:3-hydroxyacyl-CoA dehydrogenase type-2-like [Contarinia nasturtii]
MFKNLVTLVTGGASGLGRATVNRFANKGAQVISCDLPTSKGEEVAKEIGENVQFIPADVTSEKDILNLVDEISKKYGKLDVLVNCAGIFSTETIYEHSSARSADLNNFKDVLMTNVLGTINVIRLTAKLFVKNRPDDDGIRGVIVNTSGGDAFNGSFGNVTNSAACGAIHSMTKPLAIDLGTDGIRVVTIAPSFIETPMIENYSELLKESICTDSLTNPRRFGDADEFAYLVQAIILNPYINSTTIELSAGLRL